MTVTKGQYLIGKTLGSCVIERLLGYGGSSAVFLAQQKEPERKVAIKVFLPRSGMDKHMQKEFYRRFLHEAEAASKLDHPHIVPVYAYGEEEGLPYIVMPYMPGGTLSEYMAKRRILSLQEAQWYLEQLASALQYAHEQGCVHCDVKPANILLDSEGHVILSDFGIARLTHKDIESTPTHVNAPDSVMGTPDYISPEQALGRPVDGRSDIYSLGITMFFALTKRLPFKADAPIALALLHVHETPPSIALMRADVTPSIDHVIQKALAKDPRERFQTAAEFSLAFSEAVAAGPEKRSTPSRGKFLGLLEGSDDGFVTGPQPAVVITRQVTPLPQALRNINRFRLLTIIVAVGLILATAGFALTHLTPGSANNHVVPRPTPSATARPTPIDLFAHPENWPASSTFFFDSAKSYHIQNNFAGSVALAQYYGQPFGDFRLTVTMKEAQGPGDGGDYYGVVFRAAADQSQYYLFEIAPSANGQYEFQKYNADGATKWSLIKMGFSPSLNMEKGAVNTITIEAHGNTFTFSANGTPLEKEILGINSSPPSGEIGLYVENQGTEATFSHFTVEPLNH